MPGDEQVRRQIRLVLRDMEYLTRLLMVVGDSPTRSLALQQQWQLITYLQFLIEMLCTQQAALPSPSLNSRVSEGLPVVSREQLAAATGRNGNPAYVAVGGTVYDVTDNKGWSNATHFGLPAGRDLTAEFASCHAGQQWILSTLKPVGRLS